MITIVYALITIFADGTLHHIGEGLRRMSHAHLHHESDHTHNGGTRRKSVPNVDLDEEGNPTHSDNQFKRVSSAPLLDISDIVGVDTVYRQNLEPYNNHYASVAHACAARCGSVFVCPCVCAAIAAQR